VEISKDFSVSKKELSKLQRDDATLRACFDLTRSGERKVVGSAAYVFYVSNGLLYRQYDKGSRLYSQIVVPFSLRLSVLVVGHDQLLAGHCGVRRTLARILSRFFRLTETQQIFW
jgi:hypothetical protein